MTGLLSKIPGLAAHQVKVADTPAAFDRDHASSLVAEAIKLISSFYPAGALEWLRQNRTDVIAHLRKCENRVDEAILSGNPDQFSKALATYTASYQKAISVFKDRPEKVEIQAQMFAGAA